MINAAGGPEGFFRAACIYYAGMVHLADYTERSLELDTQFLSLSENGLTIRRSILPGGIRVLTEEIPHQHSTSVGLWIGAGSRDEAPGAEGSTHFLEHLLFKGTKNRSAKDIAERIDYLGGGFNAATAKQYTCYYGHVFEEDLGPGLDLLADMVMDATLAASDMEMERGVILEELAMYNDDASEVAHESIPPLVFGDHALGRPVGGSKESVLSLTHERLTEHYLEKYRTCELVVTASGAVNHEELCDMVLRAVNSHGWQSDGELRPAPRRNAGPIFYTDPTTKHLVRPVEQAAVIIGMPSMDLFDERRSTIFALNAILGGGTSSRLFQQIREERGLAYSTYSFPAAFPEGGLFGLYAACSPANVAAVSQLLAGCLEDVAAHGVSEEEIESAYRRVRADIIFDSERISSHMNRLGHAELIRGALVSQEEQLRRSREVTVGDVTKLANELASGPRSICTVGPQI